MKPPPGPMRPNPTMPERRPRGRRAEVKRLREENERLTQLVIATQERLLWALDKAGGGPS